MHKLYLWAALIFLLSCNYGRNAYEMPASFYQDSLGRFEVPEVLNEISGINMHNDSLYAIQDEAGKLFHLHPGDKKAVSSKFAKSGDYEDLAIIRGQVIILRSDGTLFSFPLNESNLEETTVTKEWKDLVPKGEYEGLYADESDNKLYVLCKQCKKDNSLVYILQLQPDSSITQSGEASLEVTAIEKLIDKKNLNFHPSALAKNPRTQEWYILSSANKLLVVADNGWNVKDVYPLDPALFRQPEGIAFDRENNLYISNEGDAVSNGNVVMYFLKKDN